MNISLLRRLCDANGQFVALAQLGEDIDRVHAELDELDDFGFALERHPYYGVAYRGPAERLCPDQIEHELQTQRIGRRIAVWNRVASTNDLAASAAGSSSNDGLVILAEEQWAGRGRLGRQWSAPARSSVLMSVLLDTPSTLDSTSWLTALGAVAVAEVVARFSGREPRIKWPNDVRVDGRKVAGILVERGLGAVIGIGLNVNIPQESFPDELIRSASSLQILCGAPLDRSELARALIRELDHWYDLGILHGPGSLSARWRALSEHLGRTVNVKMPTGSLAGVLEELDLEQGLLVTATDGRALRINVSDVLALTAVEPAADV